VFLAALGFGLWVLVSRLFVHFVGFLFCLFFLLACAWFPLYTFGMLRGALRFLIYFFTYLKKKKVKKKKNRPLE